MLTYHSNPLSNPVNPELFYYAEIQHFVYKETPCADKLWTKIFDYISVLGNFFPQRYCKSLKQQNKMPTFCTCGNLYKPNLIS